jgi:hypothetical protein
LSLAEILQAKSAGASFGRKLASVSPQKRKLAADFDDDGDDEASSFMGDRPKYTTVSRSPSKRQRTLTTRQV